MKPKYGDPFTIQVVNERIRTAFGADLIYAINPEHGGFITIKLGNGQNLNIGIQPADNYDPIIFLHLT